MTPPTPEPTTILAGPGAAAAQPDYSDLAATRDLFWQNIVREMLTSLAVLADARRSQIVAEMHARQGQFRLGNATITIPPDLAPAVPAPDMSPSPTIEAQDPGDGDESAARIDRDEVIPGATVEEDEERDDEDEAAGGSDSPHPRPGHHPSVPLDGRMAVLTRGGERIPIADVRPLLACSVPGTDAERALSIDVQCTIFQIVAPSGEVFTLPLHEIRAIHAISEDLMARLARAAHQQDAQSGRPGDDPDAKPFGFAAFTSLARSKSRKRT
jgi:hypothetical protein